MEVSSLKKSSKGWSKKKFVGEWAKTLQNYIAKNQEKVPAGFVRADDALKKMGFSGNSAGQRNKLLNAMAREGWLEKREFKIFDGSGRRLVRITHYKITGNS